MEEINPIWRIIIDNYGLQMAKIYGLTGKILLSILSFEFFAYYLIQRERLLPENRSSFFSFWGRFGSLKGKRSTARFSNMANLFSFVFALLGPFYFYVALMNSMINDLLYSRFPPMSIMLLIYLAIAIIAYFVMTYRAFRSCKK